MRGNQFEEKIQRTMRKKQMPGKKQNLQLMPMGKKQEEKLREKILRKKIQEKLLGQKLLKKQILILRQKPMLI